VHVAAAAPRPPAAAAPRPGHTGAPALRPSTSASASDVVDQSHSDLDALPRRCIDMMGLALLLLLAYASCLVSVPFANSSAGTAGTGGGPSCSCVPASLCQPLHPQPPPRIEQAVFLEGETYNGTANDGGVWPWQPGVTTVVVFGAGRDTGAAFQSTLCEAHRHGARALLPAAPRITAADNLSSAAFRRSWVRSAIARLRGDPSVPGAVRGWDGLNMDIESRDLGARRGLTALVCELRAQMQAVLPGSHLTFDSSVEPRLDASPHHWGGGPMALDYAGLARCVDYFVPMAYDMQRRPPPTFAPVPSANSPLPAIEAGLEFYIHTLHISPSQLVLAVPLYGYDVPCRAGGDQQACSLLDGASMKRDTKSYATILRDLLPRAIGGSSRWNSTAASPYFDYRNGSSHQRHRGAASAASFLAAVLAEIYLCNVCSCQEVLRRNERG
jgi:hypothetical protein